MKHETRDDYCPGCGAAVAGGRAGCQTLLNELTVQAYGDLRYAAVRDLAFDTYCMQHLDIYCRSAKSYAAHLTRLCCGLEYAGEAVVYAAIQRWLNGTIALEKPERLAYLGAITIAEVRAARTAEEHVELVRAWAKSVWAAYATQQAITRAWIKAALDSADVRGSR